MIDARLADLAQVLFSPVTLVLYGLAMSAYLYAMAFTRVDRPDRAGAVAGRRATLVATVLGIAAVGAHAAHLVVWSLAAGRYPLGNMFEFSNVAAFVAAVGALVVVQWRLRRADVVGFVLMGVLLTLGLAVLVYTEPGPLMPILDSWWRAIHVSAIVLAFGVFTVGAVFTGLYLLRDTAERRVAAATTAARTGSTVGAAYDDRGSEGGATAVAPPPRGADADPLVAAVPGRVEEVAAVDDDRAYGDALRGAVARPVRIGGQERLVPVALLVWTLVVTATFALVFQRPSALVAVPTVAVAAVWLAWWRLPHLPSASTLDSLAYRTNAFGFPLWTAGVILGAVWAEQSWGRYWGWDPKETSAFLTWVAYAGYLHARATRGWRGRPAAWIGLGAYGVLLFTYFVVNLIVTGLHSYAGTGV